MLIMALLASCAFSTARDIPAAVEPEAPQNYIIIGQIEPAPPAPPRPDPIRPENPATIARDTSVSVREAEHGYIAMGYIKYMNDNLYGRTAFSYRELEAAMWITEQLLAMGYTWDEIEVQQFSWEDVYGWVWDPWEVVVDVRDFFRGFPSREGRLSQNVILTVPGQSEQVIVVGAHYDSFPYPGASDNASGVALLLESAERMRYQDNYYTIVYVFFGAEEIGIVGAEFFLDSLSDEQRDAIAFMVNADVLFEGPYPLYAAGYSMGVGIQPQANAITRRVDAIAREIYDIYDIGIGVFPNGIFWTTDHVPFVEAGHTVVVFAGLYVDSDGRLHPRVLHTSRDCIHYINENWPGKAEHAMRTYSIFLERILLDSYL